MEQIDRISIIEAIARERAARDAGDWDALGQCYTADSKVDVSWFNGTGAEFAKASAEMAARVFSFHEVGSSVVDVQGDRALGDTVCTVHLIGNMDDVEVDVLSYIRLRTRLQRDGERWRLAGLRAVYISDVIVPLNPSVPPKVADSELQKYRRSYRGLCHMLVSEGFPAREDLPGVDKPDTVKALVAGEEAWLNGSAS